MLHCPKHTAGWKVPHRGELLSPEGVKYSRVTHKHPKPDLIVLFPEAPWYTPDYYVKVRG